MRRKAGHRALRLANSGKWYVAMTICFGVVAISSGNNVLYLLESLLLGALILSGVLSERTVAVAQVSWRRRPTIAGEPSTDSILVRNQGRLPLFCIEVGEWVNGEMLTRSFVPFLRARSTITLSSSRPYEKRGEVLWDGISVGTQYPFGFAKKIRWVEEPGKRLVWPARQKNQAVRRNGVDTQRSQTSDSQFEPSVSFRVGQTARHGSAEFSDGEIRPLQPGDDYRDAVWTLSAKRGEPVVRQRQSEQTVREVTLDLRQDPGDAFEKRVIEAADVFYREGNGVLFLVDWNGFRRVDGMSSALNALAVARAMGRVRESGAA